MSQMIKIPPFFFIILIISSTNFRSSNADIGPAAYYSPPYIPTACYGNDASEFPADNLFAAAGEGIWDNGAACGRNYLVRCISAASATVCDPSQIVQVKIVDRALTAVSKPSVDGAIIVLSETAFSKFTNSLADVVNIEFREA